MIRFIKNLIGNLRGYSGCVLCGDRWNWKKYHLINYSSSRGIFPLCEECWNEVKDNKTAIMYCVRKLVDEWIKQNPSNQAEYLDTLEEIRLYIYSEKTQLERLSGRFK